jgi:hypothetical protein
MPLLAEEVPPAVVAGVVLAEDTGKPIANAQVLVSSPAMDMRGQHGPGDSLFETRTDSSGQFKLRVPRSPTISLNAYSAGYEEAAGMLMSGHWTLDSVPLSTNEVSEFVIRLQPAPYLTGVVVNEQGRPIAEAQVEATLRDEQATGYVEFDTTHPDGRFEVFDFPLKPMPMSSNGAVRGQLTFRHPTKVTAIITNIYALAEPARTNLTVMLRAGYFVRGVVMSPDGKPMRKIEVKAIPMDKEAAGRDGLTDDKGGFELRALPEGGVLLRSHTANYDQLAQQTIHLAGAHAEVNLDLKPVMLKKKPTPVRVLGMDLVDVNPELQEVYHLFSPTGVLILNDEMRADMGGLVRGEVFWVVGEKKIKTVREMIAELLRINEIEPPGAPNEGCRGSVRVAYGLRDGKGTMTTRMQLSDEEVAELKRLQLGRWGTESSP